MTVNNSQVDVLIIGAGPAGLMLALWMSRLGVPTRIVDKRATKVLNGQADGVNARTMEIFDSFGLAEEIIRKAVNATSMGSWVPSEKGITRQVKNGNSFLSQSRFKASLLNQGLVETSLLDSIAKHSSIAVERGVLPVSMATDNPTVDDDKAYPITVELQRLIGDEAVPHQMRSFVKSGPANDGLFRSNLVPDKNDDLIRRVMDRESTKETVRAKYLIGCDGAHSWVRKQLDFTMEGAQTDYIWGVIDIVPLTDFPDIRKMTTVQSNHGAILVIPREERLVRIYAQMVEVTPTENGFKRDQITPEKVLDQARKVLAPYSLDYSYLDWWTAYQVGQRVSDKFQDINDRVFLAGDAVHTHSPKEGAGMNTSIADAYNLGWKLASVIHGWIPREALLSYEPERRRIAQLLIEMDHKISRLFSGHPSEEELSSVYMQYMPFINGFGVHYAASLLTAAAPEDVTRSSAYELRPDPLATPRRPVLAQTSAARGLILGQHLPSLPVLVQSDGRCEHLQALLKSNGRWRLLVFPGDITSDTAFSRLNSLGEQLVHVLAKYVVTRVPCRVSNSASSDLLSREKRQSLIEVLTIHSADVYARELHHFHKVFFPFDEVEGYDYEKILVDTDLSDQAHFYGVPVTRSGKMYETYGIRKDDGAIAVIRPDGYVAYVGDFKVNGVKEFFEGALIEQRTASEASP